MTKMVSSDRGILTTRMHAVIGNPVFGGLVRLNMPGPEHDGWTVEEIIEDATMGDFPNPDLRDFPFGYMEKSFYDPRGPAILQSANERVKELEDQKFALEREVASLRRLFHAGMQAQETLIRAAGGQIRVPDALRGKVYLDTKARRGAHAFEVTDDDATGDQIWTADDAEVELSPADVLERKMLKEHYGVGS